MAAFAKNGAITTLTGIFILDSGNAGKLVMMVCRGVLTTFLELEQDAKISNVRVNKCHLCIKYWFQLSQN
jgi:hypothetical protein